MKKQAAIAALLLISVIVSACSGASPFATPTLTPTCGELSSSFLGEVKTLYQEFTDTVEVANATARIALSDRVSDLQSIRRRADDLQPPGCAGHIKTALVACVDHKIDAYLAFMGEESDDVIVTASRNSERRCGDMLKAVGDLR